MKKYEKFVEIYRVPMRDACCRSKTVGSKHVAIRDPIGHGFRESQWDRVYILPHLVLLQKNVAQI